MHRLKLTQVPMAILLAAGFSFVACGEKEPQQKSSVAGTSGKGGSAAMSGGSGGASGGTSGSGGVAGGSAGTGVTAGTGGTGGATTTVPKPVACAKAATGDMPLIDDFDDDAEIDKFVPINEGRNGWWEAFEDDIGEFEGKVDFSFGEGKGTDGSNARCVSLAGHNIWGAVIAVNMGYPRCWYDASVYDGICFDAMGDIKTGDYLEFSVNTADTLGSGDGGRCDDPPTDGEESCSKFYHYKTPLRAEGAAAANGEVLLSSSEYRTFCYSWDQLKQAKDAPTPRPQNTEEVVQFEWKWPGGFPTGEVDANGDPVAGSTDGSICVDNVRFMGGNGAGGADGAGGAGGADGAAQ